MTLNEILMQNYNIGPDIKTERPQHGSGTTTLVSARQQRYVAKFNERPDFLRVYEKVQIHLERAGIRHGRLVPTRDGQLMTAEGMALYEYISGDSLKVLTETQLKNALIYMRAYNQCLKTVPFQEAELADRKHWDKARSVSFLIDELPELLAEARIPGQEHDNLLAAIQIIAEKKGAITQSGQLIHADLGPDNFLFIGDEVRAIIDFTPEYNHELYSLAQFIFWNHLWDNPEGDPDFIDNCLTIYCMDKPDRELFQLLLLRAALFRITGPILDRLEKGGKITKLEKRFYILAKLLESRS